MCILVLNQAWFFPGKSERPSPVYTYFLFCSQGPTMLKYNQFFSWPCTGKIYFFSPSVLLWISLRNFFYSVCLMFSSIYHNHFGPMTLDPDGLMFTSTYSVSPGAYRSIVATFPPFFLKVRSLPGQFLCNKLQVSESIQRRKTPKKKFPTFNLSGMCFPRDTGIKFITGNTSINYMVYELTV